MGVMLGQSCLSIHLCSRDMEVTSATAIIEGELYQLRHSRGRGEGFFGDPVQVVSAGIRVCLTGRSYMLECREITPLEREAPCKVIFRATEKW